MEERSGVFRVEKDRIEVLIRKMSSEDQTVDPRNKLMGNDHGTIFVRFRTASRQEDTHFVNSAQNANGFSQSSD